MVRLQTTSRTIRDGSMLACRTRAIYGANVDDAADRRGLISPRGPIVAHTAARTSHEMTTHPWTRILHTISVHIHAQLRGSAAHVKSYK